MSSQGGMQHAATQPPSAELVPWKGRWGLCSLVDVHHWDTAIAYLHRARRFGAHK